jgi:CelD/BcsL family acetyltransferase involved in cellulose biosynthesis
MKLSVQLIDGPDALRTLAPEADRLALSMRPRVPFATYAWLSQWWASFHEARVLLRDRFFVHALRDENGALVALAPLVLTERPGSGPVRVRVVSFFGRDKNITELCGMVCAPEHEADATRALLAHFAARTDEWDWFFWSGTHKESEAYTLLSGEPGFVWRQETPCHLLSLPGSWDEFRATRSRNIKESLRKCYNSLKRDRHSFEFRVVDEPNELRAALERFLRLHAQRAQAKHLADHADYFKDSPARDLMYGLARKPEAAPGLRAFELWVGGQLVAIRLGFLLDDELYLYFSGFDPDWGRYSVMTTTVAETIKWAIERRVRTINLSTGTDVSKTRWGSEVVYTCGGLLLAPRRRARLKWDLLGKLNDQARSGAPLARAIEFARRRG